MQVDTNDDDKNLDRGDLLPDENNEADESAKLAAEQAAKDEEAKKLADEAEAAAKAGNKDDDDDETEDEKAERLAAEAEEAKKRRIRIPKERLDEEVAKARTREAKLLAQIDELQKAQNAGKTNTTVTEIKAKIEDLREKYEDFLLDGKKAEAKTVRAQLDDLQERLIDFKTATSSETMRRETISTLKFEAALAKAEADYPALNPENDDFDADATDEVALLVESFMSRGIDKSIALQKAVRYVMGPLGDKSVASEEAQKRAREKQAAEARARAAAANGKQPPDSSKAGKDSDKGGKKPEEGGIDVMRLSQEKFAKIDEETKARLRGDVI